MKTRQKIRRGIILFSFFLFPAIFYYLSPVIIIQSTMNGVINGSFIMFFLMFMSALVLGRAYCGWVCPGAGCQEAIFMARDKKVTKGNYIKWILWVPWICAISLLAIRRGGYEKIDFLYQTKYGFSIGDVNALIAYLGVLLILIVLPAYIFGKRSFCHHLCWMAPFMILGRKIRNGFKWPSLQLKADSERCILCGTCTDVCESNVIKFSFYGGA